MVDPKIAGLVALVSALFLANPSEARAQVERPPSAANVKYTPTTPSDWTSVPTTAQQALDFLAAGGGGGGGGSLQSAYLGGPSIATVTTLGAVTVSSITADNNDVLYVGKNPTATQTGSPLHVFQNANSSDPCLLVESQNSGSFTLIQTKGVDAGADSFHVDYYGTAYAESFECSGALGAMDGLAQGISLFSTEFTATFMSNGYVLAWGTNAAGNGTYTTFVGNPSPGVVGIGHTLPGAFPVIDSSQTVNWDGSIEMGGTTGSGTLSPTWTNSPTTLTGSHNPYTWLKFVATDGTTVYVPAFK